MTYVWIVYLEMNFHFFLIKASSQVRTYKNLRLFNFYDAVSSVSDLKCWEFCQNKKRCVLSLFTGEDAKLVKHKQLCEGNDECIEKIADQNCFLFDCYFGYKNDDLEWPLHWTAHSLININVKSNTNVNLKSNSYKA